jgi:D-methionine transport system substrate-binding protein
MKTLKILVTITIIAALSIGLLAGCGQKAASPDAGSDKSGSEKPQILKVGATDGPFAQILEAVKPILAKENIDLQVVVFNDYVRPNIALSEGEIDANTFQHIPYFKNSSPPSGPKTGINLFSRNSWKHINHRTAIFRNPAF